MSQQERIPPAVAATEDAPDRAVTWHDAIEAPGGYAWWYLDALSPEGDGLVCILFAGSVFSPRYAARVRQGERALPTEHCAVNLALYKGGRQIAWVMAEHSGPQEFSEGRVAVGGSVMESSGGRVRVTIDEQVTPFFGHGFGRRVKGTIRMTSRAAPFAESALSVGGRTHAWRALVPRGEVEADFPSLGVKFRGVGYHDRNHGDGRLGDAFSRWGWARRHREDGTDVLYSVVEKDGTRRALWASAGDDQIATPREATPLPDGASRSARWGMRLPSRFGVTTDEGRVLHCTPTTLLEQAPFYNRFRARISDGDDSAPDTQTLGEWLDLDRFSSRWNQFLIGFKTRST